ncbi:MAG: flagellar hook assembly protein FlgD, partial [Bdellovibrionota bacterium]
MINTLNPSKKPGHDAQHSEVLERIHREYGAPEEKQREAVKKLGKDEFFKIMVTQIQHQDPLKPYQNEQMAAQMAQFTSLEQMMNVNQNLEKLAQAQQPLHNLGAAHLIGKFITADSSRLIHTEGRYSDLNFNLPADAHHVRVVVLNDRGENIREIEAHDLKKGDAKLSWDGKQSNRMPAKSGQYLIQISASTADGKPISVQTQRTEIVHGVAFEGKETVLLTGDVTKPQKILLKNVYKVVEKP